MNEQQKLKLRLEIAENEIAELTGTVVDLTKDLKRQSELIDLINRTQNNLLSILSKDL